LSHDVKNRKYHKIKKHFQQELVISFLKND